MPFAAWRASCWIQIKQKNIIAVSSRGDFGRAEQATIYLVYWPDWSDAMLEILKNKRDGTALVVYAPKEASKEAGPIPADVIEEINNKRNAVVSNFRGRLLNDILVCLITTGFA